MKRLKLAPISNSILKKLFVYSKINSHAIQQIIYLFKRQRVKARLRFFSLSLAEENQNTARHTCPLPLYHRFVFIFPLSFLLSLPNLSFCKIAIANPWSTLFPLRSLSHASSKILRLFKTIEFLLETPFIALKNL